MIFVVMLAIIFLLALGLKNLVLNLTQELPIKTIKQKVWAPENVYIPSIAIGFVGGNPCGGSSCVDYKDFRNLTKESEISGIYPTVDGTFWYCAKKGEKKYSTSVNVIDEEKIKEKIGQRWYGIFIAPTIKFSSVSRPSPLDLEKASAYANITIKKGNGLYVLTIAQNLLFILVFIYNAYSEWKEPH